MKTLARSVFAILSLLSSVLSPRAADAPPDPRFTPEMAEFVAGMDYKDLPPKVVEATRIFILDNLASGLVGSFTPWAAMVEGLARDNGRPGPCTAPRPRAATASNSRRFLPKAALLSSRPAAKL